MAGWNTILITGKKTNPSTMTNSIVSALAETAYLNGKTQSLSTTKSALLRRIVNTDEQDSLTTKQVSGVGGDDVLKTQSTTAQPQAATAPRKLLRRTVPTTPLSMQHVKAPSIVASTSNAVENNQGDDVSKDTMLMMSDARVRVDGEGPAVLYRRGHGAPACSSRRSGASLPPPLAEYEFDGLLQLSLTLGCT